MNGFRKFIYFCAQVDRDILEQTNSSYERNLIYASFIRQILGLLFVFAVFLYAWNMLLPLWMAISISALLAAIVFFIDQAVIASLWIFHREFFHHRIYNDFANFLLRVLGLLPRACFAVIIAIFMATLAEITIQHRAIERLLGADIRADNQEYVQRTNDQKSTQAEEIKAINEKIKNLEDDIALGSSPDNQQNTEALRMSSQNAQERIPVLQARLTGLSDRRISLNEQVTELRSQVSEVEGRKQRNLNQMRLEELPERCLAARRARANDEDFDVEKCHGRRWRGFRDANLAADKELATLEPKLEAEQERLNSVIEELTTTRSELNLAEDKFSSFSRQLTSARTASSRLSETKTELAEQKEILAATKTRHIEQQDALLKELRDTGFYQETNYGPLELYVGLKRLHNPEVPDGATDSEKNQLTLEGQAARDFSTGLWLVIILFELSPVLVAFFAPFSHVAMRMRKKREDAERDNLIDKLKKDVNMEKVRYKSTPNKYQKNLWNEEMRRKAFRMKQKNDIAEGTHDDTLKLRENRKSSQTMEK